MRLDCNENGDVVVDADLLSRRLCIAVDELKRRMRIGLVTSLVEAGTGADEGLRRVTVRCGRTAWRATIDDGNNVTSEELLSLGDKAS